MFDRLETIRKTEDRLRRVKDEKKNLHGYKCS